MRLGEAGAWSRTVRGGAATSIQAPRALAAGWDNYQVVNWHKCCRGIWGIVTERRIIDVVSDLLGDTVVLRHSHLFAKLPGDPKRVSWHQDASYWPLTPSRVVSAWLAIDNTDDANSAMQVIGGSHHHAQLTFRGQRHRREQRAGPDRGQRRRLRRRAGRRGDAGGSDLPAQRPERHLIQAGKLQPPDPGVAPNRWGLTFLVTDYNIM